MVTINYIFEKKSTIKITFIIIAFFVIAFFVLRCSKHKIGEPQPIRVTEEILTLQMNPTIIMRALEENGSDWCTIKRKSFFNSSILITATDVGNATFNRVFLTDSVAPIMAQTFPHLFEYTEDDEHKIFTMKAAGRDYVIVPVWLVKSLIDLNILTLPNDKKESKKK